MCLSMSTSQPAHVRLVLLGVDQHILLVLLALLHDIYKLAVFALEKCAKFGVAFRPKSCNMGEECEAAMEARAGVLDETNDRWSEGTGEKWKGEGGL